MNKPNHRVCVAPMMNHTDRHFRYFLRLISRHVMLYTEMVTTGALLHGNARKILQYNPEEHPLALQLGGSRPDELAGCARLAAESGYDEVNLNVGCPSDRVQSGKFGACLMAEPALVGDCIAAMQAVVTIPVTVKCRIGINDRDTYDDLAGFVNVVRESGCHTFIIHARKAVLEGLSPRQNREVPPLKHEYVHRLKREFPELEVIINGGISSVDQIQEHLRCVDGVMLGRTVCNNPYLLATIEAKVFHHDTGMTRGEILRAYMDYIASELSADTPLSHTARNILGFYHGRPGARKYRRYLSANIYRPGSGIEVIESAVQAMTG